MKALTAVVVLVFAASAAAGEVWHPLNPTEQPLAAARADTAKVLQDILRTRQAKAFGLDGEDFSGSLPGTNVRTDSARNFLAALADAEAENLWCCLLQDGGTLAKQTGGFGWEAPDGAAAETLDPGDAVVDETTLSSGKTLVALARDRKTMDALTGGVRSSPWRSGLLKFIARRDSMAGVLANARPLIGLLSLATGADIRGALARFKLNIPGSVQLELFNNAGDLGFEARLNTLVPEASTPQPSARREVLSFKKDPLLEVNFPAPERILRHLPFDTGLLALANLDAAALLPQTISLTLWRTEEGAPAWAAVCLISDRDAFRRQLARVTALLDAFHISMTEAAAPAGQILGILRADGFECATALVHSEGKTGYFILSGTAADFPDPRGIRRQTSTTNHLIQYRSVLNVASREEAAQTLEALSRRYGRAVAGEAWEQALPEKDSGYLSVDGESLVLMSRNGLLPLLAPSLPKFIRHP